MKGNSAPSAPDTIGASNTSDAGLPDAGLPENTNNPSDHLLTPKDAAAFLRMPVKAVVEETRKGRLGHYRLSHKRILISMGHIRAYLESVEMTGTISSKGESTTPGPSDLTSLHSPVDKSAVNPVRSPREGGVKSKGTKKDSKSSRVDRAQLREELRKC